MDTYATFARLVRVQTRLWNEVDARLRTEYGVPLADLTPLELVSTIPGCRVQDIVDALHITVGGASKVVDRLVAGGYVARAVNPVDRRSSLLTLSPAGRELLEQALPTVTALLGERLVEPLGGAGLAELDRLLGSVQLAAAGAAR